jgi:hypothetical protein
MRDFIAGCCAALNPSRWVEESVKKAIEWEPTPAKMRSSGDISEERGTKETPKKRKRTSSTVGFSGATNDSEGTKPVVEMQSKHEDTGRDDPPSPVKKAKGEAEVEVKDGDAPAGIWTTQPNQEGPEEEETTNETADSPGHSSKIPTNPEVFDVWFWRHQLQKAVCNDSLPKDKVPVMSLISRLMSYFLSRTCPSSTRYSPSSKHTRR